MRARSSALFGAALLGGCASLLSLDELQVKKDGAAGSDTAGGSGTGGSGPGTGGAEPTGGASGSGSGFGGAGAGGNAGMDGGAGADASPDAPDDAGPTPIHPPGRPTGEPKPSGTGIAVAFAAKGLYFGVTDPVTKKDDVTAWRRIGFDVDGQCTTVDLATSAMPGTCTRLPMSPTDTLVDGDQCRDNNFGSKFMVTVRNVKPDIESKIETSLATGAGTMMLLLSDLDPGPDDPYVPGAVVIAAPFEGVDGGAPAWDGTDVRKIDQSSLLNKDFNKPIVSFPKGYVKGNVWVSGDFDKSPAILPLPLSGTLYAVPTLSLTFTATLSADHKSSTGGVISGAVDTKAFVCALKPLVLAAFACSEQIAQPFVDQFNNWADLSANAPNFLNPATPCDAMSLGAVLDWHAVKTPGAKDVVAVPIAPNPCFDGGVVPACDGGF